MKYRELLILLPCHSLEDFPLYHEGDDAQSLLANWSALWHPALLAAADATPLWRRVDDPPEELAERLIVVPTVSAAELPTGFAQRAKEAPACLVRKATDRGEIVAAALASLDGGDGGVDPKLADDFMALGYAYLQVELLTRQMRYSSNLDEVHFRNLVLAGAQAALAGDADTAQQKLAACYDLLGEERDHYYPVDAYLLDVTLVAETTLGQSLRAELASPLPRNVWLPANLLPLIADREPDTLAALREAWQTGRISIVGGEVEERRLPLLSLETLRGELLRGGEVYEKYLGKRPVVFARRRFGPSPLMPGALDKLGFIGAVHAALDDGKLPQGGQAKVRWEGLDGAPLDAWRRAPLDAMQPHSYLNFCAKLGESMDGDHVATIGLAHWPGQGSLWRGVLERIAPRTAALGKFVTLEQYFQETDHPGQLERFEADQYRSPYLKQAVIRKTANPISSVARYWRRRHAVEAGQALATLAALVHGDADIDGLFTELAADVDRDSETGADADLDARLDQSLHDAAHRLAAALPTNAASQPGVLFLNPSSFVRRVGVETPEIEHLPAPERPIYATGHNGRRRHAVIDAPPMGFVWIGSAAAPAPEKQLPAPLAEDGVLRNEFFEATINPTTGAVQAIHEYNSRGNRFSQQLAVRLPMPAGKPGEVWRDADERIPYSVMAADAVDVTCSTHALGEITARGRLVDQEGKLLAGYTQVFRLWRGSRVLHIDIELEPHYELRGDAWGSYVCSRFAWANEGADLFRTLHQTRQPATTRRIESSHYIDIADEKTSTTILTGGLPFHQRIGDRMLDTLLIVRGETCRRFHLGIGVDLKQPLLEAQSLLAPTPIVRESAAPSGPSSSWLFHVDARNVVATWWQPLLEERRVVGYRARLLETVGNGGRARVSSFRPAQSARRVDFRGRSLGDLTIDEGVVRVELSASEWAEIEVRW